MKFSYTLRIWVWAIIWSIHCLCASSAMGSEVRPCPIEPTSQTTTKIASNAQPLPATASGVRRWVAVVALIGIALLVLYVFALLGVILSNFALSMVQRVMLLWLLGMPVGGFFGILSSILTIDSSYITTAPNEHADLQRIQRSAIFGILCGLMLLPVGIVLTYFLAAASAPLFIASALFVGLNLFALIRKRPQHTKSIPNE